MRQLTHLWPHRRWGRKLPIGKLFGPNVKDMTQFMAAKYDLPINLTRELIEDVFRYIHGEVLLSGRRFIVSGFGVFHRIQKHGGIDATTKQPLPLVDTISLIRTGRRKWEDEAADPQDAGD